MNNATIIAERDSLRAAFIRYIDFDAHFENMQGALRGGAMGEVVSNLSSTIEDVVFNVLNECKTSGPKPSN